MRDEISALKHFSRFAAGVVNTAAIASLVSGESGAYATYLECLADNATLAVRERASGAVRTLGPVLSGFRLIGEFTEVTASAGALIIGRSTSVD